MIGIFTVHVREHNFIPLLPSIIRSRVLHIPLIDIRNVYLYNRHLRQEYSRAKTSLRRTWTPMMASMGTSVRGMLTACGGK